MSAAVAKGLGCDSIEAGAPALGWAACMTWCPWALHHEQQNRHMPRFWSANMMVKGAGV